MIVIMDHLLEALVQVLDFMIIPDLHHIGAEEGAKMKVRHGYIVLLLNSDVMLAIDRC